MIPVITLHATVLWNLIKIEFLHGYVLILRHDNQTCSKDWFINHVYPKMTSHSIRSGNMLLSVFKILIFAKETAIYDVTFLIFLNFLISILFCIKHSKNFLFSSTNGHNISSDISVVMNTKFISLIQNFRILVWRIKYKKKTFFSQIR